MDYHLNNNFFFFFVSYDCSWFVTCTLKFTRMLEQSHFLFGHYVRRKSCTTTYLDMGIMAARTMHDQWANDICSAHDHQCLPPLQYISQKRNQSPGTDGIVRLYKTTTPSPTPLRLPLTNTMLPPLSFSQLLLVPSNITTRN